MTSCDADPVHCNAIMILSPSDKFRIKDFPFCIITMSANGGPDQTVYIRNSFIGMNVRLVEYIIYYYDTFKLDGLLLCLDFKKVFDTLECDFLFEVLLH